MSTVILNVVIVLGIIIAGGFLIFFVGDLLLSIIDPTSDDRKIKQKRKKDVAKFKEELNKIGPDALEKAKEDEDIARIIALSEEDEEELDRTVDEVTGAIVETYKERESVEESKTQSDTQEGESDESESNEDEENSVDEDAEREKRIAEARAALERRKEEILKRLQASREEEQEEEHKAEESSKEDTEEKEEEEVVEEVVELHDEKEDDLEEERKALEAEKAKYKSLITEIQQKQKESKKEEVVSGSKEEYLQKLKEKEEALEENEKELRTCNKEYKPLNKVRKNLEKDEKKLRIKEAQVAKQKVLLYGVNNYGDIDEEKAKKLSEELDLLDGLKLSVEHCREVMEENKDRLPILEKMHEVLTKQNQELKEDIEYLKSMIEKFDEE